ncbi:MAG TPA: SpoIIE family protein phosphatase [Ktedonobacteraceae bacterium]|nr:SpoIIE family protein phosphatase [Ktedonobacteraceae bacterium]
MSVFQVKSSIALPPGSARKRPSPVQRWVYAIFGRVAAVLIVTLIAILLGKIGLFYIFFVTLPVGMSLIITRNQLSRLLHGTFLYGVFTLCLALMYYGSVTGIEILIHTPGFGILYRYHGSPVAVYIVAATTLAWAIILAPVYNYVQGLIDRRFNLRDYEAARAVEAFTSALREEIDLEKVCDGLLAVVQKTMKPLVASIWVRKPAQDDMGGLPVHAGGGINNWPKQHEAPIKEQPESITAGLDKTSPFDITIAASDPMIVFALSQPGAVEVRRLQLDSPVLHILRANEVEIVLPLISQGELIGLFTLGPRLDGQKYARADRSLLEMLVAQVAPALRVAQLAQAQQAQARERERIEQELRTAQEIQHTFLPREVPSLPGWQLVPYYQSAREVGGDFYDFLPFADGRLGIVIGDVTDKGMPAALVMTATRTMLRTAAQEKTSPSEVLARVNDLLFADIPPNMFVTCFYALLDPESGHLRYANAGHEPPFRQRDGSAAELWATGTPLGMMPGTSYEEYETTVTPGESLLFYSDGLVEAHNRRREMFGFARLKTLLEGQSDDVSLIDILLGELQRFTGEGWEQEDDVTLVALHRAVLHETPGVRDFQKVETLG